MILNAISAFFIMFASDFKSPLPHVFVLDDSLHTDAA